MIGDSVHLRDIAPVRLVCGLTGILVRPTTSATTTTATTTTTVYYYCYYSFSPSLNSKSGSNDSEHLGGIAPLRLVYGLTGILVHPTISATTNSQSSNNDRGE
jgi:hypothetical protein